MKIYPVLSSDLYALSCVSVSKLERLEYSDLRRHFERGGSLKFLVSQETMGDIDTETGYMSKHAEYSAVSTVLAEDFRLSWLQDSASQLSDFVRKNDLENSIVQIDSLPQPYIVSSFHLSCGSLRELSGYALSDALSVVVPKVKYSSISADSAVFGCLSSPVIDDISAKIPAEASEDNQLADKEYVSALVHMNASNFRGTFGLWRQVPTVESGYLSDQYGNSAPNDNDYMVVREVNTLEEDGGRWPDGIDDDEKQGTWRFRYIGEWGSGGAAAKDRWYPEYRIEHYNFTPEELLTLKSGVTETNRVIRDTSNKIGDSRTGVYVDEQGRVRGMEYSVNVTVPSNAKFTETQVLPGEGIKVSQFQSATGDIISFRISSDNATSAVTGGIRVGRGLTAERTPVVDVATAVKVVEIEQNSLSSPEQLSSVFGNEAHVGAIMIVKRGYDLTSTASYTGYVYTGQAWEAMAGNCCADNVILKDDIKFGGSWSGSVGNIQYQPDGKFPCGGKSVAEAFKMIFGDGNTRIRVSYPHIGETQFMYEKDVERSPLSDIVLDENISIDGISSEISADDYVISISLPDENGYEWSDGDLTVTREIPWKISPISVYLPETLSVYFTDEEVSVDFDISKYGITNGTSVAVNVDSYECELTLSDWPNCVWGGIDNPDISNTISVTWHIVDPPEEPDAVRVMDTNGNMYGFKYSKFNSFDGKLAYVDENGAIKFPFGEIEALSSADAIQALSVMDGRINTLSTCSFSGCSCLVSVDIPYITNIQESAFISATMLETVNCPAVENIEIYAFDSAGKLGGGLSVIMTDIRPNSIPAVYSKSFNATSADIYLSDSETKEAFEHPATGQMRATLIQNKMIVPHVLGD